MARGSRAKSRKADTTRNEPTYNVIVVWGGDNLTPQRMASYDRRHALRYAKERVQRGAKIVLVKKGTPETGFKLIADFSTVGGAA
ncbi:MAG: hypothetical protein HOV92_12645 [Streptomyces sp.]|nr:hypothetical protein [Streptomyces sp.]